MNYTQVRTLPGILTACLLISTFWEHAGSFGPERRLLLRRLRGMMKAVWDTVTLKASWTLNNNLPCRAGQPVSGPGVAWPLKCSEEPELFISLQPGPPALSFQRTTPNDYWMPSFSLASILLPTCIHIICPFM